MHNHMYFGGIFNFPGAIAEWPFFELNLKKVKKTYKLNPFIGSSMLRGLHACDLRMTQSILKKLMNGVEPRAIMMCKAF